MPASRAIWTVPYHTSSRNRGPTTHIRYAAWRDTHYPIGLRSLHVPWICLPCIPSFSDRVCVREWNGYDYHVAHLAADQGGKDLQWIGDPKGEEVVFDWHE